MCVVFVFTKFLNAAFEFDFKNSVLIVLSSSRDVTFNVQSSDLVTTDTGVEFPLVLQFV